MNKLTTITLKAFSGINKCIDILKNEYNVKLDLHELSNKDCKSVNSFVSGAIFALNAEKKIEDGDDNIYTISISPDIVLIHSVYFYDKSENIHKESLTADSNIEALASKLAEGAKLYLDFSNLESDRAEYCFNFISGVAYALSGNLNKLKVNEYEFSSKYIIATGNLLTELQRIHGSLMQIDELVNNSVDSLEDSDLDKIIQLYEKSIYIQDENKMLTPLRHKFACFLETVGKKESALEQLKNYLTMFIKCNSGDLMNFGMILNNVLELYSKEDDNSVTMNFILELTELCTNYSNESLKLDVLNVYAVFLIDRKRSREALNILHKVKKIVALDKCDSSECMAFRFNEANANYHLGHFIISKRIVKKHFDSLELFALKGDSQQYCIIEAYRLLAGVYSVTGKKKAAIRIYEKLITEVYEQNIEEYRDKYSLDMILLAGLYQKSKNIQRAIELYEQGIDLCGDNKQRQALYCHNLATCYMNKKKKTVDDVEKAKELFLSSINTLVNINDDPYIVHGENILRSLEFLTEIAEMQKNSDK